LREFPHLYVDNSGLCSPSRFAHVPRLANDELIASRTVYGSDWPVPSNAFYYTRKLGLKRMLALEGTRNSVNRDIATKRALGYPDATLTRAASVLAHLDRWL